MSDEATPAGSVEELPAGRSGDERDDGYDDIVGSGALLKKILVEGAGDRPETSQQVELRATLSVDGKDRFTDQIFTFRLGEGDVCSAWDLVVALMLPGETCHVKGCYRFHPIKGCNDDSAIAYTLELLKVSDTTPPEDASVEERLSLAEDKRERAKAMFTNDDFVGASEAYKRAVKFLVFRDQDSEADRARLEAAGIPCWNNLAAVQIKLKKFKRAVESASTVLLMDPDNVKALFRKAKAHSELRQWAKALDILKRAASRELSPGEKTAVLALQRDVLKSKKAEDDQEKNLYKKMVSAMGTSPDVVAMDEARLKKEAAATKAESLSRVAPWMPLALGTLAAVAGMLYALYA